MADFDLSEVFRKCLQGQYKKKGDFGQLANPKQRIETHKNQRKATRCNLLFEKRRISKNITSCPPTPMQRVAANMPNKTNITATNQSNDECRQRLEKLAQWKAERDRNKRQCQKNAKKVFKVSRVPVELGLPNLEHVNTEIKGKPFAATKTTTFVPVTHKNFVAPANIKPIHFNEKKAAGKVVTGKPAAGVRAKVTKGPVTAVPRPPRMVTRSQAKHKTLTDNTPVHVNKKAKMDAGSSTPAVAPQLPKTEPTKVLKNKGRRPVTRKSTPVKLDVAVPAEEVIADQSRIEGSSAQSVYFDCKSSTSSASTDYPIVSISSNEVSTPDSMLAVSSTSTPVYVSPFVTIARGKNSARKEYHSRNDDNNAAQQPLDDASVSASKSPKAGARYFRELLDNEISRLEALCIKWETYKQHEHPVEESWDVIDVAVGQSRLLISKKFEQFRNLIDQCEHSDSSQQIVTCTDLHGFWDMIYMQVVNLNKRFAHLDTLKANNWREFLPEIQRPVRPKRVPINKAKKSSSSSSLKDAINAARLNKQKVVRVNSSPAVTFNGGFFSVTSPEKQQRLSCLKKDIRNSSRKSQIQTGDSPGLQMMRVSMLAKSIEKGTPGKSILKRSDAKVTTAPKAKVVLFKEDDAKDTNINYDLESVENDLNKLNVTDSYPVPLTPRRSKRLSKAKLFDS